MPGSGKTYWSEKICDLVIDDITDLNDLPDLSENKILLGICDVNFCDPLILKSAIGKLQELYVGVEIDLFYFENDVEKCRKNVKRRNDGRPVEGSFRRFKEIYKPPKSAKKIWVDNDVESL